MNETKCPICLENLSKYDSDVLAGSSQSCRHEFCLEYIEEYYLRILEGNDNNLPVALKCPVCNSNYLICEHISEICKPVHDVDFIHAPVIDLTCDVPVIDLTGDD